MPVPGRQIGQLEIPVEFDTRPLERQARRELKRIVEQAGDEAGKSYGRAFERAGGGGGKDAFVRRQLEQFRQMGESIEDVGDAASGAGGGVRRLDDTVEGLARTLRGTHPAMDRVMDTMSSFALSGALMTGVLAGIGALVLIWERVTEKARQARAEQAAAIEQLKAANRARALGPTGETQEQLKHAEARLAEVEAEIAKLEEQVDTVGPKIGTGQAITFGAPDRLKRLKEEYDELTAEIAEGERFKAEVEAREIRAAERRIFEVREQIRSEREREREDAEKEAEQAATRLARAEGQVQTLLAGLTARVSDELLLQIDKMEEEYRAAAAAAGVAVSQEVDDAFKRARAAASQSDELFARQQELQTIASVGADADAQADLELYIGRLQDEAAALEEGSAIQASYNDLIRRALELRSKNAEAIDREAEAQAKKNQADAEDAAREQARLARQALQDLRERARLIEENARAAVQLANAFGLVSDETAAAVENIAQVGAAVARIAGGDLSAIPSALGGIAQLAKGLFGGEDEAEARKDEIRAMQDLERALRDLEGSVRGDLSERERQNLAHTGGAILSLIEDGMAPDATGDFLAFADRVRELTDIDVLSEDGTGFDRRSLEAALEALRQLATGAFGDDLASRLDALRLKLQLLGDAAGDQSEQLEAFLEVLGSTDGGRNLATAIRAELARGGVSAATELMRSLVEKLLDPEQREELLSGGLLSGLTGDEALRALQEALDFLGSAEPGSGTTQNFVQARSITEITATRIEGALFSANALYAQGLELDRERNQILRGMFGGSLSAPQIASPSLAGAVGSGVVVNFDKLIEGGVHVTAAGGVIDEAQLTAAFERGAGRFAESVNRRLGERQRRLLRSQGRQN